MRPVICTVLEYNSESKPSSLQKTVILGVGVILGQSCYDNKKNMIDFIILTGISYKMVPVSISDKIP